MNLYESIKKNLKLKEAEDVYKYEDFDTLEQAEKEYKSLYGEDYFAPDERNKEFTDADCNWYIQDIVEQLNAKTENLTVDPEEGFTINPVRARACNNIHYKGIATEYVPDTNTLIFSYDINRAKHDMSDSDDINTIVYRNETPEEIKQMIDTQILPYVDEEHMQKAKATYNEAEDVTNRTALGYYTISNIGGLLVYEVNTMNDAVLVGEEVYGDKKPAKWCDIRYNKNGKSYFMWGSKKIPFDEIMRI